MDAKNPNHTSRLDPRVPVQMKLKANPLLLGKVTMPEMFTKPSPPFHKQLIAAYLDPKHRLVNIQAPRGHAKSSVMGGIAPLHHLMHHHTRTKFIVLVSKTQKHAKRLLQTIKDTLDFSEGFRQVYGYWGQHSAKKWTDEEIRLKDGSVITCVGTGQQVRGLKIGHQRPTLIILDDPEDENNTRTAEAMRNNLDWVEKGLVPSVDSDSGKIIVIGTPLHQSCLVETLRDSRRWHSLHFSAELNAKKQLPLWPEKHTWADLQAIRADAERNNRLSAYYQEYLCSVIPDEDRLFKPDDFRYYQLLSISHEADARRPSITFQPCTKKGDPIGKPITSPCYTFMGIDPATSTRDTADYTVIMPIAMLPDTRVLILPYTRARMAPSATIEKIISTYRRYRPLITSIEATGAQETFRDILRQRTDISIPGLAVKHLPRESKYKRHLEVLEPYFAANRILMAPGDQALFDELVMHPKGKHDDILDALYYALLRAKAPNTPKSTTTDHARPSKKPPAQAWMNA